MKNKIIKYLCYLLIGILILYLFYNTNFNEMFFQLKKINITTIIILLLLQCFTQYLLTVQWYRLTNIISSKKSISKIFYILSSGSVIEALTPGAKIGGEFTRYHYLKKEMGTTSDDATKIIIVQKSISMSVLFSICIVSTFYVCFVLSLSLSSVLKILLVFFNIFLLVFLLSVLFSSDKLLKLLKKYNNSKIFKFITSYNDSIKLLSTKEWTLQFIISFLVWFLFPLKMVILASSLNVDQSFMVLLAITMTAYAIGTLPITPGGIGTFETSMISLFSLIHVNTAISLTLTAVFRIITFWFVFLISLIYSIIYKKIERSK